MRYGVSCWKTKVAQRRVGLFCAVFEHQYHQTSNSIP